MLTTVQAARPLDDRFIHHSQDMTCLKYGVYGTTIAQAE